ncbi:DUF4333 domain-containing protein [Streptomyces sp. NP160]|uniref:DUF4333 domain-containing protein n=1 Tax=Streptomyces sp. NP160 TaxID=2586637 RepID=UPI00111860F5|nr:DUF4333 domain-containing protein [Streptomyces sp. NP160]TNM59797.1 DUF4333 domain-containing protein [Streptomyces sp. NP160]
MSRTARCTAARRSVAAAAAALGAAALLSACSFSYEAGTPDYSGADLATDVTTTLAAQYPESTFDGITCDDTPDVDEGQTTACHGVVDGADMDFTINWKDSEGNFAIDAVEA